MIINIIGIILSLLILSLLCSCGSRNQQKPPYREDSYLYWNNATKCIEIYCGSLVIGSNRARVGSYVPEQWRFQDGKWDLINTPDSMGRVKLIFDEKQSELLLLPLWADDRFYAWNGEIWACKGEYPEAGFISSGCWLYSIPDKNRSEIYDYEEHKKWYLESCEWIEDSNNNFSFVPFKLDRRVESIYDLKSKMYIIFGMVDEVPESRIFGIKNDGSIKEIGSLSIGSLPVNMCYNFLREKVVIITKKDNKYGIFEICEDHLLAVPSENTPDSRFRSLFAYDHSTDSIVMFGGYRDRYPILPDKYYQDTWATQYSNEKGVYIWERIQDG